MPTLDQLRYLEARLAAATGPDRELDCDLQLSMLGDCRYGIKGPRDNPDICSLSEWVEAFRSTINVDDDVDEEVVPRHTSSIDAAVALCERAVPYATYSVDASNPAVGIEVILYVGDDGNDEILGMACSVPLAICLAIVRALIAQEEAHA